MMYYSSSLLSSVQLHCIAVGNTKIDFIQSSKSGILYNMLISIKKWLLSCMMMLMVVLMTLDDLY